jgi:hypothetical protein
MIQTPYIIVQTINTTPPPYRIWTGKPSTFKSYKHFLLIRIHFKKLFKTPFFIRWYLLQAASFIMIQSETFPFQRSCLFPDTFLNIPT